MKGCVTNVILVGFASTGKTAVGRVLSEKLGFTFVDLDDRVEDLHKAEKGVGRKCREIYGLFGRDCFIRYETRALEALAGKTRAVIAVGGGTPLDDTNRNTIRNLGTVFYLKADPAAVFERMKFKGFPKYLGENPTVDEVAKLTSEREPFYLKTADFVVDNTKLSLDKAADAVIGDLLSHGLVILDRLVEKKDESV